jgi:hypothetical protein
VTALLLALSAVGFAVTLGMHVLAGLGRVPSGDVMTTVLVAAIALGFPAFYGHPDAKVVSSWRQSMIHQEDRTLDSVFGLSPPSDRRRELIGRDELKEVSRSPSP